MKTILLLGGSLAMASLLVGCGDDTGAGGGTGGNANAGVCEPAEGCPSVPSECIAFTDNTGKDKFSLRISELTVEAPAALATSTVKTLLDTGVTLDYPACKTPDEFQIFTGDGTFNWILEFDTTASTLRTGGAALETDPNNGYCFLDGEIAGFDVTPLETSITIDSEGVFEVDTVADVVVPIFTDPTDQSKVILLPLRGVKIEQSKISEDNNCIGTYNAALQTQNLCLPDNETPQFAGGGRLDGHITLEDADGVNVPELGNASLCALIAGADFVDQETKKCKRTGDVIDYEGDWCAGTVEGDPGTPATADCKDAVRLSAGYSAFGVTLRSDCP